MRPEWHCSCAGDSRRFAALAQPVDSGKKTEKDSTEKRPAEKEDWKNVGTRQAFGNVEVNVLEPTRGALPPDTKAKDAYVLIVPVTLELKGSNRRGSLLTSWMDLFEKEVSLKDDQNETYDLLDQNPVGGSDGKTITEKRITVANSSSRPPP